MIHWEEEDKRYIWHPCTQAKDEEDMPPIIMDYGRGRYLYDIHGKPYLDIISSWWCNLLGHGDVQVNAAIHQQLEKLEHVIFAGFSHTQAITLARRLHSLLPSGLDKFQFTDNGSSAVECALKMSFQYHYQTGHPERRRFMALSGAYHGETIGALSVGAVDVYSRLFHPLLFETVFVEGPDCFRCPYGQHRETCQAPCFEAAERAFSQYGKETAAFIAEPLLQGAAGMRIYPPVYLRKLRSACDAYGVHLIADEIAAGFGRTGTMFACEQAHISPDMMCLSKGLTGGYLPMAITAVRQEIYDAFYGEYISGRTFMHSHTYSGNPLACAAANAVLDVMEQRPILETARHVSDYTTKQFIDYFGQHPHTGEIRHIGLIHALELVEDRKTRLPFNPSRRIGWAVYKEALQRGLLLRPIGDVLYFNPPLTITKDEIDEALHIMAAAMAAVFPS